MINAKVAFCPVESSSELSNRCRILGSKKVAIFVLFLVAVVGAGNILLLYRIIILGNIHALYWAVPVSLFAFLGSLWLIKFAAIESSRRAVFWSSNSHVHIYYRNRFIRWRIAIKHDKASVCIARDRRLFGSGLVVLIQGKGRAIELSQYESHADAGLFATQVSTITNVSRIDVGVIQDVGQLRIENGSADLKQ